jgi:hypothetical protein
MPAQLCVSRTKNAARGRLRDVLHPAGNLVIAEPGGGIYLTTCSDCELFVL